MTLAKFHFRRYIATFSYILLIVLINTLFLYLPRIPFLDQTFAPTDIVVGIIYIMRDFAQREIKHYIFIAMLVGIGISYLLADKEIALASLTALGVGETLDWAIYTYTRKPLSQRLLWSSMISVPIDTYVFLAMIDDLHAVEFFMMLLGKVIGVLLVWIWWRRFSSKKKMPA